MQGLGAHHISIIKFDFLDIGNSRMKDTFGKMPVNFKIVAAGNNGNGKTELTFQFAKEVQKCGRIDYFLYESGHGADIQDAIARNRVKEDKWNVVFYDPYKKRKKGMTLFEEFYEHVKKSKGTKFYIIDSVDACRFEYEEYRILFEEFGSTKGFYWTSYEGGNKKPKTSLARAIGGEGDCIWRVKDFIVEVVKSRTGGWAPHVIWEEKAKERNPLWFEKRDLIDTKVKSQNSKVKTRKT